MLDPVAEFPPDVIKMAEWKVGKHSAQFQLVTIFTKCTELAQLCRVRQPSALPAKFSAIFGRRQRACADRCGTTAQAPAIRRYEPKPGLCGGRRFLADHTRGQTIRRLPSRPAMSNAATISPQNTRKPTMVRTTGRRGLSGVGSPDGSDAAWQWMGSCRWPLPRRLLDGRVEMRRRCAPAPGGNTGGLLFAVVAVFVAST